jgi:uncharacterized protein (DUF1778 family)
MVSAQPRITTRVDEDTKELLLKASKLSGEPSINAFVLSSAVDRAKEILKREQVLELSDRDFTLFLDALDSSSSDKRLKKAYKNYHDR